MVNSRAQCTHQTVPGTVQHTCRHVWHTSFLLRMFEPQRVRASSLSGRVKDHPMAPWPCMELSLMCLLMSWDGNDPQPQGAGRRAQAARARGSSEVQMQIELGSTGTVTEGIQVDLFTQSDSPPFLVQPLTTASPSYRYVHRTVVCTVENDSLRESGPVEGVPGNHR